jgi:hypothetical protein
MYLYRTISGDSSPEFCPAGADGRTAARMKRGDPARLTDSPWLPYGDTSPNEEDHGKRSRTQTGKQDDALES